MNIFQILKLRNLIIKTLACNLDYISLNMVPWSPPPSLNFPLVFTYPQVCCTIKMLKHDPNDLTLNNEQSLQVFILLFL